MFGVSLPLRVASHLPPPQVWAGKWVTLRMDIQHVWGKCMTQAWPPGLRGRPDGRLLAGVQGADQTPGVLAPLPTHDSVTGSDC